MGYTVVIGTCGACGSIISYNPRKVPSIKGMAICRICVDRWRALHPDQKFEIPEGAYDDFPEEEL